MIEKYKIADVVFSAEFNYTYTKKLCSSYVYEGEEQPNFFIQVTKEDIEEECKRAGGFPPAYLESLALYRKFLNKLLDFGGTVFHSSALAVDGKAYLFTAPSGTGKSTHISLWQQRFGNSVQIVNGDKPIMRFK